MTSAEVERVARRVVALLEEHGLVGPPADFITPSEFARRLSVSDRTLRDWMRRGTIRSTLIDGARRIPRTELDRLLARCRKEAA